MDRWGALLGCSLDGRLSAFSQDAYLGGFMFGGMLG